MKIKKHWYKMSTEGGKSRVDLYGFIGAEVTAQEFAADLTRMSASDAQELELHIHSGGGVVTEGFAIYNSLMRWKKDKKLSIVIDGLAASMATVIASAGDKVTMPENGLFMIHKPWVFMGGDAEDLRHEADLLDKMEQSAIKAYSRKSKLSEDELRNYMSEETWFTAEEALEAGFIDEIEDFSAEEAYFDPQYYNRIPENAEMFFRNEKAASDEPAILDIPELPQPKAEARPKPKQEDNKPETPKQGGHRMNIQFIINKTVEAQSALAGHVKSVAELAGAKLDDDSRVKLQKDLESFKIAVNAVDFESEDEVVKAIEKQLEEAKAQAKVLVADAILNATQHAETPRVEVGEEDQEKFVKKATMALMGRGRLLTTAEEKKEYESVRREGYGNATIQDVCREALARAGVSHASRLSGSSLYDAMVENRSRLMVAGQGTGDFSNVFEDVANKALYTGWTTTPTTYQAWTGQGEIPDFKTKNIVKVTEFGDVSEIKENQSFPMTSTTDTKETASLITVGVAFGLSRQAIINDDINALIDPPSKLSRSLQRYINRRVYTLLYGSAMVGPTMNETSAAMLSSTHSNFVASGSGGAPTNATLSDLRRKLMKQTLPVPDGTSANSPSNKIYSMATPRVVLFHGDLDQTIEALLQPAYVMTGTADTPYTREFIRGLIPVSDPVLDELMDANSHKGYYLIADPADVGSITVYNLSGNSAPTLRRKESGVGEALGTAWDIYYDVGFAAEDYRGIAGNYGE